MPTISEIMTPSPQTVERSATLQQVAEIMRDHDTGAVPVLEDGKAVGIVTDRDIAVRVVAEGKAPADCSAADACSTDVVTVRSDDDSSVAVDKIRSNHVRRLLVVDDDDLKGIVTIGDLALAVDDRSALADISGAQPNS